jgi:hypothetical protein
MATFTETTTLDEVTHSILDGSVTVTWRDHLFKDGEEVDSARVMRQKTYLPADIVQFHTDLGADAATYISLFSAQ